ncbi:MAG TPA: hypothetical protein VEC57_04200 [Candidatus Limnocylindrales bacterium]|nr:hypothetical protein [Candidatus Limnocylindrales bacterium]
MTPHKLSLAAMSLALAFALAACTSDEKAADPTKPTPTAKADGGKPAAEEDARPRNIPILEGYKYYVAGPVMKKDPYGRYRITDFQGEVAQPPSRGLIFGVKRDGDRFEYKVWANGRLVGAHRGIIRDGLYWPEYREGYRDEKLVAREYVTNDDAAKVMRLKVEDIDPATGEVIRTSEGSQTYSPPALPEDADEGDEGEGDQGKPAAPAAAAPQPQGAASSAPAAAGAKPQGAAPSGPAAAPAGPANPPASPPAPAGQAAP